MSASGTIAALRPHHRLQQAPTAILVLKCCNHISDRCDPSQYLLHRSEMPASSVASVGDNGPNFGKVQGSCLWLIMAAYDFERLLF